MIQRIFFFANQNIIFRRNYFFKIFIISFSLEVLEKFLKWKIVVFCWETWIFTNDNQFYSSKFSRQILNNLRCFAIPRIPDSNNWPMIKGFIHEHLLTLSLSVWNTRDNESSEWMSQKIDLHFGQKPETRLMCLSTPDLAIS